MTESGFQQLKEEILRKLHEGLDPKLTYHSVGHTKDVMQQAERIAISEKISDARLLLLIKIASLFHDTGFLCSYKGHEEKSCDLMFEMLDPKLFDKNELSMINNMILATKLPQVPRTLPEKIICDADLDYLGREDFEVISGNLKKEFFAYGIIRSEPEWNQLQVRFFESHLYFTETSIRERYPVKMQYLEKLRRKIVAENP
ncbi:MAG TPA: hypothetical protein VKA49_15510 [Flavitalea sp.]|nr:hypothetical protein [Flavitalea sp.]